MVIWLVLAALLGVVCVALQSLTVRQMHPDGQLKTSVLIALGFFLRIILIVVYFWQVVQQGFLIIVLTLLIFLGFYFGSAILIAYRKPHWLEKRG